MHFSLPSSLPKNLEKIQQCRNAAELIDFLSKKKEKYLIPFFATVCSEFNIEEWKRNNNPFLRGRIHMLALSHLRETSAKKINGTAENVFRVEEHRKLAAQIQNHITVRQHNNFNHYDHDTQILYSAFTNKTDFFTLFNTDSFVAGMMYEKVRLCNEFVVKNVEELRRKASELKVGNPLSERTSLQLQQIELDIATLKQSTPLYTAYELSQLYQLRAGFTPDDNGFLALVDYCLSANEFDKLLFYLSKIPLVPIDPRKIALADKSPDAILHDLREYKSKYGAIFSTRNMKEQLSKVFQKIEKEWMRAPVSEDVDDKPKVLLEYLNIYEKEGYFFNEFWAHCLSLHEKANFTDLLQFLSSLPMPKNFKQHALFGRYRDNLIFSEACKEFESFRKNLSLQKKAGLYQTLYSVVNANNRNGSPKNNFIQNSDDLSFDNMLLTTQASQQQKPRIPSISISPQNNLLKPQHIKPRRSKSDGDLDTASRHTSSPKRRSIESKLE